LGTAEWFNPTYTSPSMSSPSFERPLGMADERSFRNKLMRRVVRCANQHVYHQWTTIEVPYPRYDAGPPVRVALPNQRKPFARFARHHLIQTKALDKGRGLYYHCAHYLRGVCDLGDQCTFIHAVFVQPTSASDPRVMLPPTPSSVGLSRASWSAGRTEATTSTISAVLPSQTPSDPPTRQPARWWYRDPHTATRVYVNPCVYDQQDDRVVYSSCLTDRSESDTKFVTLSKTDDCAKVTSCL
jgi:hypothetical protein